MLFLGLQTNPKYIDCTQSVGFCMQVHCVQAFGKLEEILREEAPLPDGLVLHSWGGSGAQVKSLSKLEGVYFSISGHSLSGSRKKIRPMLKQVGQKRLSICHCTHSVLLLWAGINSQVHVQAG